MGFGDKFTRQIHIRLGDEERSLRKDRLVTCDQKIHEVAGEKAAVMGQYNGELKELRREQKLLLAAIETGIDIIETEVVERCNDRRGEVETVRVDTGEVLHDLTRPLTSDERQLTLANAAPKKPRKSKKAEASA